MQIDFKAFLLNVTCANDCQELEVIQALWSGYGKISRYSLDGAPFKSVIVKHISPKVTGDHPRGWHSDFGHQRKVKSYVVERYWYTNWADKLTDACKIPQCFGTFSDGENHWIVLEDLNLDYPLRKENINLKEVRVVLSWLAAFHGRFLTEKPKGLWEIGTYWHLATRPAELKKMTHQKLKAKAPEIDTILNNCTYKTIVHGDAKLANFCFSADGKQVAAVDFQYVGGGCGMKDVIYFLGSCLDEDELRAHENSLLDYYFACLKTTINASNSPVNFALLEAEWRRMYPIASADFTRFLLGWMPTHAKLNAHNLMTMEKVLSQLDEE